MEYVVHLLNIRIPILEIATTLSCELTSFFKKSCSYSLYILRKLYILLLL